MTEQADGDEILVVHSLREAGKIFGGRSPDTIKQWCVRGRLDATFSGGRWTIRIPPDHPDLPRNRRPADPIHYPRVEAYDERAVELADLRARVTGLESENALLTSERDFLREQQLEWQRQLPALAERLVEQLRPPALPAPEPEPKPRFWWLLPWKYAR
jgi:hypothetical protein